MHNIRNEILYRLRGPIRIAETADVWKRTIQLNPISTDGGGSVFHLSRGFLLITFEAGTFTLKIL